MKKTTLLDKAELALKEAIRDVIKRHKQTKRPLVIWKDGKVVKVSTDRISYKTKN